MFVHVQKHKFSSITITWLQEQKSWSNEILCNCEICLFLKETLETNSTITRNLLDDNKGNFLSIEDFNRKYDLNANFLLLYQISLLVGEVNYGSCLDLTKWMVCLWLSYMKYQNQPSYQKLSHANSTGYSLKLIIIKLIQGLPALINGKILFCLKMKHGPHYLHSLLESANAIIFSLSSTGYYIE